MKIGDNMENASFRQAGKETFGKVYKGSVVDAYNRLTQPSIPSKTEKLLQAAELKAGFGCSALHLRKTSRDPQGPASTQSRFKTIPLFRRRATEAW